jgi:hypothetical protein
MTINKEFIDQPLHLIVGAALVIGFSFITSLWMAAIISAMTGLVINGSKYILTGWVEL